MSCERSWILRALGGETENQIQKSRLAARFTNEEGTKTSALPIPFSILAVANRKSGRLEDLDLNRPSPLILDLEDIVDQFRGPHRPYPRALDEPGTLLRWSLIGG